MRGVQMRSEKQDLIGILMMVLLLLSASALPAFGTSYPPALYHLEERHDRFVKGDVVYLFHSGTNDVRTIIHSGDTMAVYRVTPSCEVVPVGVIKVTSFEGDTYLKGEVFAGEIKPDDIAKKEKVSCLVISAGMCNK
jgi:hypothetical protein